MVIGVGLCREPFFRGVYVGLGMLVQDILAVNVPVVDIELVLTHHMVLYFPVGFAGFVDLSVTDWASHLYFAHSLSIAQQIPHTW